MFEIFMLTMLLAVGLSQLIPETTKTSGNKLTQNKKKKSKIRADVGAKTGESKAANVMRCRYQAQSLRTLPNSSGGTGRLKKNPCI